VSEGIPHETEREISEVHHIISHISPPAPPPAPGLLARVPASWRVLGVILAIMGAGAAGHAYTAKFATTDMLHTHPASMGRLPDEVAELRERLGRLETSVSAIQADVSATRTDMRALTRHLLENPPPRGGR
jgi:hypothetical protein